MTSPFFNSIKFRLPYIFNVWPLSGNYIEFRETKMIGQTMYAIFSPVFENLNSLGGAVNSFNEQQDNDVWGFHFWSCKPTSLSTYSQKKRPKFLKIKFTPKLFSKRLSLVSWIKVYNSKIKFTVNNLKWKDGPYALP